MSLSQALPGRRLSQHSVRACGGHAMIIDGNTARRQHCPTATPLLQALPGRRLSQHLLRHSARHCKDTRTRARAKRALSTAPDSSAASPRRTRPCCASARCHAERTVYCTAQCRSGGVEPARRNAAAVVCVWSPRPPTARRNAAAVVCVIVSVEPAAPEARSELSAVTSRSVLRITQGPLAAVSRAAATFARGPCVMRKTEHKAPLQ